MIVFCSRLSMGLFDTPGISRCHYIVVSVEFWSFLCHGSICALLVCCDDSFASQRFIIQQN